MRIVVCRLMAIAALVVGSCLLSYADDKPELRSITVTGEAEVKVAPDEVVFDVTVQTINRDLRVAKSQTDDRLRKVMGSLAGIRS